METDLKFWTPTVREFQNVRIYGAPITINKTYAATLPSYSSPFSTQYHNNPELVRNVMSRVKGIWHMAWMRFLEGATEHRGHIPGIGAVEALERCKELSKTVDWPAPHLEQDHGDSYTLVIPMTGPTSPREMFR